MIRGSGERPGDLGAAGSVGWAGEGKGDGGRGGAGRGVVPPFGGGTRDSRWRPAGYVSGSVGSLRRSSVCAGIASNAALTCPPHERSLLRSLARPRPRPHTKPGAPLQLWCPPAVPRAPPGDVPTARLQVRGGMPTGARVTGRASGAGVVRGSRVCCTVAMALAAEAVPLQTGDSGRTWGCVRREAGPGPPRGGMCRTGSRVGCHMPALVDNAAHALRTHGCCWEPRGPTRPVVNGGRAC